MCLIALINYPNSGQSMMKKLTIATAIILLAETAFSQILQKGVILSVKWTRN